MQYTYRTLKDAKESEKHWGKEHKTSIKENKRKGGKTFTLKIK